MSLASVARRADVREVGVQLLPASGSSGGPAVYVDDITIP